ncbi:MAG: hypothetical protein O7C75_06020, partial [Verrucomicrobia bacterium]|nr:hypothetical protein [Verrucomicrobiota bacterium]
IDLNYYGGSDSLFGTQRDFGGRSALNELGQVVFWAELEDGRQGIFLWSPPPPEPKILSALVAAGDFVVTIASGPGSSYQFQSSSDLSPDGWSDEGAAVLGDGSILEFRKNLAEIGGRGFFRIVTSEAL